MTLVKPWLDSLLIALAGRIGMRRDQNCIARCGSTRAGNKESKLYATRCKLINHMYQTRKFINMTYAKLFWQGV